MGTNDEVYKARQKSFCKDCMLFDEFRQIIESRGFNAISATTYHAGARANIPMARVRKPNPRPMPM